MRLYLDANLLITAFETQSAAVFPARRLIGKAPEDRIAFVTSELTLAEVLVKPLQQKDTETVLFYRELFQHGGNLTTAPVDRRVIEQSAEMRAERSALKLPDAIHLATAINWGCSGFLSDDNRLGLPIWEDVSIPQSKLSRVPLRPDILDSLADMIA